jgi:sugar lactone lactonase YvrE
MEHMMNSLSSLRLSLILSDSPQSSRRPRGRRPVPRLCLEALEDRTVPTTISVAGASLNEIGDVSALVASDSGGLNNPRNLAFGPDGSLYVTSNGSNSVIRYNAAGQLLGTFVTAGSGGLNSPFGLAFGPDGNLYVGSIGTNAIYRYSGTTGAFLNTFVSTGSGGLSSPRGIVFGQDGNLYVSSFNTNSILRFQGPLNTSPGSPLPATGQSGADFVPSGSGGLTDPVELVFGPGGSLYVSGANSSSHPVIRFDGTTGSFISTYVTQGEGGLAEPRGLAFDQDGRLYVADLFTSAIHRYGTQGQYLDDLVASAGPSLRGPFGMIFDAQGSLLVSTGYQYYQYTNSVLRYDRGVTVTLSGSSSTAVTVDYTTVDGTATSPKDYTAQAGTVTFAPGQTSRRILLATREEAVLDGNESFSVQLSNATGGATIAIGSATLTIVDPARQFSIADAFAIEADHTAHYRGAFIEVLPGINLGDGVTFNGSFFYTSPGPAPTVAPIDRYDATTGAFIDHFIPAGRINGVRDPIFRNGFLYVGSEYTNEVLRYDAVTGAPAGVSGLSGDAVFVPAGSGGISGPHSLCFGPDGNLYVTGRNSFNVVRYDGTTGQSLGNLNTSGSGSLSYPEGLTIDAGGIAYVTSTGTNQIQEYNTATGAYLGALSNSAFSTPKDVKFGPDGLLYVLSSGNNRILRFTPGGSYVDDFVPAGSGGMTNNPNRMGFGPDGDLYVAGVYNNNQIYRFGTENEAIFTATNTLASTLPLTVNYATADGTAVAGRDYKATSATLTFTPGSTSEIVRVPILDDGVAQSGQNFTLTLSNAVAATLSRSQAVGSITDSDAAAKFYVVNDATSTIGGTNTAFKYQASGTAQAPFGLSLNDLAPMGVAANASGTVEWVVDANKNVYVYSPGGTLLGSWSAGGLSSTATLTGIATNGTDIWLVDSSTDKVYKYTGAATRLSGSQAADNSFSLSVHGHSGNGNPQDMVTDGTSFWVVDGSALKVFKYTLSGSSLGSWAIDPANTHPTGITINPNNVSDIWIVDNGTLKIYQYTAAASRTSGSQNASATFALAAGDTNPQGIADPPAAVADVPALPSGDALFALLVRDSGLRPGEASIGLEAVRALTPPLDGPPFSADRAWISEHASSGQKLSGGLGAAHLRSRHEFLSEFSAVGRLDRAWVGEGTQASAIDSQ